MLSARVMVVEDERIVALNLKHKLINLGYQAPIFAATGEQALEKILATRPDIILMDINIDGDLDGIDTAARIPTQLQIPVIYLTAYSGDETVERARETRPYGYLLKPFSDRELHATIQMALERHQAEMVRDQDEAQLRLALAATESAHRAQSEFLVNTSREIRTPLNCVLDTVDLLQQTPLDDTQRSHVKTIQHSGNQMLALIDEILDFSDVEVG